MLRRSVAGKQVDDLAEVLWSLTDRSASRSAAALVEEVESLRLIVQQMATTLALHEVQIQKLRECLAAMALREGQ